MTATTTTTTSQGGYQTKIPGATLVRTPLYEETLTKAAEMLQTYGTLLVTGRPGLGKTATAKAIMYEITAKTGIPGVFVQLGRNPNPKEVLHQLLRALGIRPHKTEPAWMLALELGDILATERRTVWIDEAQYLRTDAFTTLRTIHDRSDACWMLGLVGSQALPGRLASDQPELLSRVGRRVEFFRIDDDTALVNTLAAWHPLLAGCEPGRLLRMDRLACKGNFREWEHLLQTLVRLAAAEGALTERVEALALHQRSVVLPPELKRWL